MIYLVTANQQLFESTEYKHISVDESLKMISSWKMIQFDTETTGTYARLDRLLSAQFGDTDKEAQIVVDCTTIDIGRYKEVLESKYLIGQNLKFDLQFLYNHSIIPRKIYDTMIVEQFLHLGYPAGSISYSLKEIAYRRLNINIDKTVRGEIIWRGVDSKVIKYAASDVKYLFDIMKSQLNDLDKIPNACIGAKIECDFTPAIAYLEWCGIKLDEKKWKAKMAKDQKNLEDCTKALNDFVIRTPALKKFTFIDKQGDLWSGFNLEPQVNITWTSSPQVVSVAKALGFDTKVQDKKTGEDKDSAMEKHLRSQKGINDEFLRLFFGQGEEGDDDYYPGYSGSFKVVSSFGQGHLNAICPTTGRIHTIYKAIGTISGRMSSGSQQPNNTLAKYKGITPKKCTYPNMQQLPHNPETRACFVAEKGNLFCSCDYSAMEARCGADVYNEHKLLDEFLYGSGDTHAAYAKAVFAKELEGIDTKDIKKKRPDLRSKVKSVEFAVQFGSDGTAVAPQLKISVEEARQLVNNLLNGMTGLKAFKERSSKFVMSHGYVEILPQTGHRGYWHDWEYWKEVQKSYTPEFWEDYRLHHKGTGDAVAQEVKRHFKAKSKWCDRMSLNLPTQGGGAVVLKEAVIALYNWVVDNGYYGKILFCNFTHDEINTEFPQELKDTYPNMVAEIMKNAAAKYYHKLPIPAEPEVGDHWIH